MEGPSLVILAEELAGFKGKKITEAFGNSKNDLQRLVGEKVKDIFPFGKYLNVQLKDFGFRLHFLMFGSYRINERRDMAPRLALQFKDGEISFYNLSVKFLEGNLADLYDKRFDIMSPEWDKKAVTAGIKSMIKKTGPAQVGDVLLDQALFAGVGNIIKNEVLWRVKMHPEEDIAKLSSKELSKLIDETRAYSLLFYELKKKYILRKSWQVYRKKECPRCGNEISRRNTGLKDRRSHWCTICQELK